ncbi:hypothetical protein [Chryseobacterium sp. BIGb0232]|uniref:hypothetical protein n=1 Tax=Chryseobacterium sp. BIGb0232 TaxID=2940598 RepID=UPI000F49C4A3|nr:hypothetical protein [Chryseobacterium sp. BIGb0232]MCS4303774.1 hypothetical protein [Chryseobacterium sp. BIGb0232]ROS11687.1 hypothetical protein EDF65_4111 [Chryseobacterium nakagawai]
MILKRSLLLTSFIFSGLLYSQANVTLTLPVVTLMDVEPIGNITLNFTAPTEAGNPIGNPTPNTSKWINYTSAITSGGLTRRITAAISGTLIQGVNIRLQAAAASGAGGGTLGTPSAQVTLTNTPVTIISGIGGAYTGNGANNGHRLTISLVPSTYTDLSARPSTALTIVYTITE